MPNLFEANCEIVIATTMGEAWSEWFDGFEVTPEGTTSRLVGTIVDQSALHGILGRLRDLGIPILDVHITPATPTTDDRWWGNTPVGTRRDGHPDHTVRVPNNKEEGR